MKTKIQVSKENKRLMDHLLRRIIIPVVICLVFSGQCLAEAPAAITLAEGLRIATDKSRGVNIAKFNERMAESDTLMARSALLPRVDASGAYTNMAYQPASLFMSQTIPMSDSHYYSYSISIQQLLFDFRGSLSRYEASRMILEAQKLESARIRNAVAYDFTMTFYDFLESQHLVEAMAKEIERLEAHFRDANHLFDAGVITRNDLLQVQVRLSDARQKQLSVQNQKAFQAARLNNLLQQPLSSECRVMENEGILAFPVDTSLDAAWEEAARQRTEIRIVDRTIDAIDLETTAQKSEFLPRVFVKGSNDYMENPYQEHENNWSLMLGVSVNLFEGGKTMASLQKTKTRKRQLLEQRAKLIDEIKLELQRSILDRRNAYARIIANKDAVGQAKENLRINNNRYSEGEGTATEVLDAVTLLTTVETNHIRSIYDYRKAEAATHYATGTDLLEVYR
jgi:outer membrane protein